MRKVVHHPLKSALAACVLTFGVVSTSAFATSAAAAAPASAPQVKAAASKKAQPAKKSVKKAAPAKLAKPQASDTVTRFAGQVTASHDNGGLPFVILDKRQAAVFLYHPDGRLNAATPVLLGYAAGDESVPGIGKRPLEKIKPGERTTPAGRFLTSFRPNGGKMKTLWMDYDAAVALHPLRELSRSGPREGRWQRLKSSSPADNRITYGCINVPDPFFDEIVTPAFAQRGGIVYVLPESKPLDEVFPTFGPMASTEAAAAAPKQEGEKPS